MSEVILHLRIGKHGYRHSPKFKTVATLKQSVEPVRFSNGRAMPTISLKLALRIPDQVWSDPAFEVTIDVPSDLAQPVIDVEAVEA